MTDPAHGAIPHNVSQEEETNHNDVDSRTRLLSHIDSALDGAVYNTAVLRENIYVLGQTGYSQFCSNATVMAELADFSNEATVDNGKYPPEIMLLLVPAEATEGRQRTPNYLGSPGPAGSFKLVSAKRLFKRVTDLGVIRKWNELKEKTKNVIGIRLYDKTTAVRYLSRYLAILEWYTNCDFFQNTNFVRKLDLPRGNADEYYFTQTHQQLDACTTHFRHFREHIHRYLGGIPLKSLNGALKILNFHLNLGYAKSTSEADDTIDSVKTPAVLVVGMGNLRSGYAKYRLDELCKKVQKPVYTVSSNRLPYVEGGTSGGIRDDGVTDCNLYTKFDSTYLLADMLKKFKTDGGHPQFTHVYMDHYANLADENLQEAGLESFYATSILLLKECKLLSDRCKILVPFNPRTVYHLHMAWNAMKEFSSVHFLTEDATNDWFHVSSMATKATIRIENGFESRTHCVGTEHHGLQANFGNKIMEETRQMSKKRKKGEPVPFNETVQLMKAYREKWNLYSTELIKTLKWIEISVGVPNTTDNTTKTGSCVWPESNVEHSSAEENNGGEANPEADGPPNESEGPSESEEDQEQTKKEYVLKFGLKNSEAFEKYTVKDGLQPIITVQFEDKSKIRVRIEKVD